MSILCEIISETYPLEERGRYRKVLDKHSHPSSLVVDAQEDIFYYHSRAILGGDAFVWLTKILGYSNEDARNKLKTYRNYEESFGVTISHENEVVVLPRLVDVFWSQGSNHREYWYTRGINDQSIDRFRLGFNEGWYMIPIMVKSALRNFQMRRDEPDKRIKNWYSGVGPQLFNSTLLSILNTVVICEGPTDCIRLNQAGIPAVSHNGGSSFWNPAWNSLFTKQSDIFVCYDNDDAGMHGATNLAKTLGEYKVKIVDWRALAHNLKKGYDVIDFFNDGYDSSTFSELLLKNSKLWFEYD